MFQDTFTPLVIPVLENGLRLPSLDLSDSNFNKFDIVSGSNYEYLMSLTAQGLSNLVKKGKIDEAKFNDYLVQCKMELETFQKLSLVDYALLVHDFITWAKAQDIPVGPGRGSSAGSCVFFALGITMIDPLKYGLYFSRFISEARAKVSIVDGVTYLVGAIPDVDTDFSYRRRGEVLKYIEARFPNRTAKIATYGKLTSKICIKEVIKCVLNYTEEEASRISGMVEKKFGTVVDLEDSYKENETFRKWVDSSEEIKRAYGIALSLEEVPKSKGQHASGIAISYSELAKYTPVERTTDGSDLMTSFDMKDVASVLVKIDALGLKNLDIIYDTCKMVGIRMEDIDTDDQSIYDFLNSCEHFYSFFQIEKGLGKDTIKKIKPKNMLEVAACISVGRPGAMKFIPELAEYYNSGAITKIHPEIDEILKSTGNIIIYQEQINAICQEVYGMSPSEADLVRYIIGKKMKDKMAEVEPDIRARGEKLGIPTEVTDWFWTTCNNSADYLFNQCIFEDCTVEKDTGEVAIKDIKIGDIVKAYDVKANQNHYVEVINVYHNEVKVFKVNLANGKSITCSMKHKLLCSDYKMHTLREIITCGHFIVSKDGSTVSVCNILSLENLGVKRTIDLEVNHSDHNFYCQDIVVSNSHGFVYSLVTLMDVYLKAHYPNQFYLACLNMAKEESDSSHETAIIQKEMRLMNVELLPPSLRYSEFDFKIEDKGIRYGLSSIKGISDAGLAKLLNFNRINANKIQLFNSCLEAKLGLGVVKSLINAGCFDDFNLNRPKLLLEFQTYNELTAKEKKTVTQFSEKMGDDTFAIIRYLSTNKDEKGKEYIKESRMATLRKNLEKPKEVYSTNQTKLNFYNWYWERNSLGYSYSNNLIELFNDNNELVTLDSALGGITGEYFTIPVCVKDVKKMKARQSGKTYYKVFIDDDFADGTILSFESTEIYGTIDFYEQWKENLIIIARVKKTEREYLIAEWIKPMWNEKIS